MGNLIKKIFFTKYLLFSLCCIGGIETISTIDFTGSSPHEQYTPVSSQLAAVPPIGPNSVELVKVIFQGVIAVIHLVVSLRRNKRNKQPENDDEHES